MAEVGDGAAARDARAKIEEFRESLYAGRGPGIDPLSKLAKTRDRPTIGGRRTGATRACVHLATRAARGDLAGLEQEAEWSRAQFSPEGGSQRGRQRARASRAAVALSVAAVALIGLRRLARARRIRGTGAASSETMGR